MGKVVVEYTYDAWGKVLTTTGTMASTIGAYNPFRYRGYYYDSETGWYYLQSRYYDPIVGRFLNADSIIGANGGIIGYNLFAYCSNNPIMFDDLYGLCAKAWAAGYQGPCPGQGLPGCMDNWPQFQEESTTVSTIDPNSPPDHPDYIPPKKGGGKKVKNPNGSGKGWPAKDGGVWVHTPNMHGGEGWTIQYPGGDHSHAYPGGGVRKHFEPVATPSESIIKIFVGVITTGVLIADDFTIVGAADDALLVGSVACVIFGLDGMCEKKFALYVEKKNMDINSEKLKYLLNNADHLLGELIDNVLSDSETDPHYSAVTATNKIKCYIQVMRELGEELPYSDVQEFFEFNAYTQDEYGLFEKRRNKEMQYYRGVQY